MTNNTTNFELYIATTKMSEDVFTSNGYELHFNSDRTEIKISKDGNVIRQIRFVIDEGNVYPTMSVFKVNNSEVGKTENPYQYLVNPYLVEEFEDDEEIRLAVSQFVQELMPDNKVTVKWNDQIIDLIDEIDVPMGGMFVIPNHAALAAGYILMNTDKLKSNMDALCKANGFHYDPDKDHLVQIWCSSYTPGFRYDNLQDHHPSITDKDGNEYEIRFPSHLPECIARTLKEGEPIDLVIPDCAVTKYVTNSAKRDTVWNSYGVTTTVKIRLYPEQTITRYRRFGKFEEVVDKVCY